MEPSPKPSPKTSTVKSPGTPPVKTATFTGTPALKSATFAATPAVKSATFAATAIRSPGTSRIRRKAEEAGLKLKIVAGQDSGNFGQETEMMTPKVTYDKQGAASLTTLIKMTIC